MGRRRAFRGAALILSAALCCAGCGTGKTAEAPPSAESVAESINRPFDVAATIKMGGIEAEADLNRTENGVCTFLFHQPAALDGMTVTLDRDTIGLSYLGLSVEADSEKVLSSSVTKAIVASINLAAEPSGVTAVSYTHLHPLICLIFYEKILLSPLTSRSFIAILTKSTFENGNAACKNPPT